ncbi:DUF6415 family natural product biosynthesis protein [Streptomyces sp. 3214.6]|uniref:DUF6415 family natural product biosynthesis protein n=1 Tax=Streptomyces sp. 3214.6 TaxID=1882757 RepID=UPI0009095192|nr:DUF6415 family natural product biosynthesis protein [Streptomyces sp. 3214.6]SHI25282.1 hypothetical protein SAMN05444521_6214 [Streptomyces sp. 3214.6]
MTNGTAPPVEDARGAKMTIRVYTITPEGLVTPPRTTVVVPRKVGRRTTPPVDIATMRETVEIVLNPDAAPEALSLPADEVVMLTRALRGHLELLIPVVEHAAGRLGKESVLRYCALACVGEARGKLRSEPDPRLGGSIGHARRLARVLNALCDHHEKLGGGRP